MNDPRFSACLDDRFYQCLAGPNQNMTFAFRAGQRLVTSCHYLINFRILALDQTFGLAI